LTFVLDGAEGLAVVAPADGVVVCEPEVPVPVEFALELEAPLDGVPDLELDCLCAGWDEVLGCPASGSTYC
jgi:hypothetical protein